MPDTKERPSGAMAMERHDAKLDGDAAATIEALAGGECPALQGDGHRPELRSKQKRNRKQKIQGLRAKEILHEAQLAGCSPQGVGKNASPAKEVTSVGAPTQSTEQMLPGET